jgi:hypothetical protein
MLQSCRSQYLAAAICAAISFSVAPAGNADVTAPFTSGPPPDVYNNFGFPMSFDVSKMDPSADPRQDFQAVCGRQVAGHGHASWRPRQSRRP